MSVTFTIDGYYFYFRIAERNRALPCLLWGCRDFEASGRAESHEHMREQIKMAIKMHKRSVPVRETKTCDVCDKSLQGRENEGTKCSEHDFQ